MGALKRIQAIHDEAARRIEEPIDGIDPKYRRVHASVWLSRSDLKALAIVLRAAKPKRKRVA